MSTFTLLSIALIAPTVFGLPVPQYGSTVTLGGLTTSITPENGGFSSASQLPSNYNSPSNTDGGEWKGNGGNPVNWPSAGNAYDDKKSSNGYGYDGVQGGSTSTVVTTSGSGGTTSSSQSYKKTKRHEPEPQPKKSQENGSWLSSSLSGNLGNGKSYNSPVGAVTMGGLTSSITLGDHK